MLRLQIKAINWMGGVGSKNFVKISQNRKIFVEIIHSFQVSHSLSFLQSKKLIFSMQT